MAVAHRMVTAEAIPERIGFAMKLYAAAWRVSNDEIDRLRVVKTVLDIMHRTAERLGQARSAVEALPLERFRTSVQAGLAYYAEDHAAVFAAPSSPQTPDVQALKADALRKLRRYDEAVRAATTVLHEGKENRTPVLQDARVSALCCRGYCHLERGREDPSHLPLALVDFGAAIQEVTGRAPRSPTGALGHGLRAPAPGAIRGGGRGVRPGAGPGRRQCEGAGCDGGVASVNQVSGMSLSCGVG